MPDRPNVLFLAVDSLRADAVFGDRVATPNLDALMERGAAFTQCIATATTTTPSFSSMLTGCYPPKHGVRGLQGYRLAGDLTTLAEAFAALGYNTYAEVTGPLLPETGILRGFQHSRHRQAYKVPFFGWRDDVIEAVQSYVEPWFMLLHIWEVHRPYRSPPDFAKRKDKIGYERAVTATDEWLAPVYEAAGDAVFVITGDHGEEYPDTPFEFQMVRAARKLRRSLKLATWFPYLDDRFAQMEIGHGFALYEHLIRVPLIVGGPGIPQRVVNDQVRHVDLFPTLADLFGLKAQQEFDGRSLKPLVEGGALPEQPAYMEAVGVKLGGKRIVGARIPDWKLIRPAKGDPALYRVDVDQPDEKHNLYSRNPEVAHKLESYIDAVQATEREAREEKPFTADEEATIEQHLKDLGYL